MSLPINKSKLPREIKGEALIDLVAKTGGEYGRRPKRSEVKKFFKGTEVSQRPYAHLGQDKAAKRLKEAYEHFGIKESGKQVLGREVSRIQTEQQSSQLVKKSSGGGFLNRLFGGRKTVVPSAGAYKLSQQRAMENFASQLPPTSPPASPPATPSQPPDLQPFRPTPNMKK